MKVPTTLAPWLSVRNSINAVSFYKAAFGTTVVYRLEAPDGSLVARLSVDGAEFWLSEESPDYGNFSPKTIGGGSVRMILTVTDPDAYFTQGLQASQVLPVAAEDG